MTHTSDTLGPWLAKHMHALIASRAWSDMSQQLVTQHPHKGKAEKGVKKVVGGPSCGGEEMGWLVDDAMVAYELAEVAVGLAGLAEGDTSS